MRYRDQPEVRFKLSYTSAMLKTPLPYTPPSYSAVYVQTDSTTSLDEVASRVSVYGEGGEIDCWKIFDENVAELFEAKFDAARLGRLRIP